MTTEPVRYQPRTKIEKVQINWNQLTPIVSDNLALKQKLANISALPFHQLVRQFDQLSPNEITILFQTGILTNKILLHQHPTDTTKRIYFTAYSVQFLQHLLERHLVAHDIMLLVQTRDNEMVLKPIMYDNIQTLNYLLLKKQANPNVADSNGCPSYLDNWRQTNPKQIDIFKLHKLLTLGATGIGVDTNGNNILHFIVSGIIPWGPISNVLRYFMKKEDLKSLVSQPNLAGLQPLHLLMKQAFVETSKYDLIEIISFLIELGADVNARIKPSGLTLLHIIVINYVATSWTDTVPNWLLFLSPYFRIIPDESGITPLVLALHFQRNKMIEFIQNHLSLSVRDVQSCQAYLITSNSQKFTLYNCTNRVFLFLRVKLGIACTFRSIETLIDNANCDKLVLALNNVNSCSELSSPWFLGYMEAQMESLLIRTVNETMDYNTLCYFLHCYLESLNSEYSLPTASVTQKNYLADFNFQLTKHLTRIVRAIGHLRNKCKIDVFIDKFLSFLYKQIFPLLDKKLKPSDINAVKFGYVGHFIQDVVFQITIVLYIWYNQVSTEIDKENIRTVINSVWQRIIHGPNSQMSVLGMCVASITAWRVKICVELKLDCTEILQLFKEIGANFNARMLPSCLTPITWILTNEQAGRIPAISLLKCLYELGGYLYVRNEHGLTAIDLALRNSALKYRLWGQTFSQIPRPLKTVCAECIVANNISIRSLGRSKHLIEFVNLHKSRNNNELFVFKSGEICVSFQNVI